MRNLGEDIACILTQDNQISEDETCIYAYLFNHIIGNVLFDMIIIIIGFCFGKLGITLCYLSVTTPLRYFAGGFHADTKEMCAFFSYGFFLLVLFLVSRVSMVKTSIWLSLFVLCGIVIYIVAPVDTKNKRLSESQRVLLRKRCAVAYSIIMLFLVCFVFCGQRLYYTTISICVILETVGLLIGIWKNRRLS